MNSDTSLILGEFQRSLDDRYRLSLPPRLVEALGARAECLLTKEIPGALSLWNAAQWQPKLDEGLQVVASKLRAGKFSGRTEELQRLGRLLSTRQRPIRIADRGRLLIPEGFREFLGVEPGGDVLIVGAAVCIEIWNPPAWVRHLEEQIPNFERLYNSMTS